MLCIRNCVRVACIIAGPLLLHTQALAGEVLRIGGTGSINGLIKSLGPPVLAETGITLELIPGLGTGGGIAAVVAGVIDLSAGGRPLNSAEIAKGAKIVAEFRTPFVMATSHAKPNGLKSTEIAGLYESDKPVWADGSPIRIILRPTNESDTWLLGQVFPGMSAAIATIRKRVDLTVAATDQDNLDMAERISGSLVGTTLTQVKMEERNLRFVAIDAAMPSLANFETGVYPFSKTLYFTLAANGSAAADRFLAFLRSPKGAAALREAGVLPGAK